MKKKHVLVVETHYLKVTLRHDYFDDEEDAAQDDITQFLNSLYAERDAVQEIIEPTEEERAMCIVGII